VTVQYDFGPPWNVLRGVVRTTRDVGEYSTGRRAVCAFIDINEFDEMKKY